jgi:hypothetical protein
MPLSSRHRRPARRGRAWPAPARVLCLAVVTALLALPAWAAARTLVESGTVVWPEGEPVRVFDASAWPRTVRTAAAVWNRTAVTPPIRFVASRADATVVIESGDRLLAHRCAGVPDCEGFSSRIGWRGGREHAVVTLPGARAGRERVLDEWMVQLAAHELGHVLGLSHDPAGCELMNPGGVRGSCAGPLWTRDLQGRFLCGPFGEDLPRAERLYGRRAAADYSPWCSRGGGPPARSAHRRPAEAHRLDPTVENP